MRENYTDERKDRKKRKRILERQKERKHEWGRRRMTKMSEGQKIQVTGESEKRNGKCLIDRKIERMKEKRWKEEERKKQINK